MCSIGVVIVTYNRLPKLKKALCAYERQTYAPEYIVVVNNCSSDGTEEYLEAWRICHPQNRYVINVKENVGGSGGFYLGQKFAIELDAPWIMISDDDAYPDKNYLEEIHTYIQKFGDTASVVCGKVIENGSCETIHRSFWKKNKFNRYFHIPAKLSEYNKDVFYPDFVSYVGTVFKRKNLISAGLVDKDLFIWYDDTEHSYRMKQEGQLICLPHISMFHDVSIENSSLSWKWYYGHRNSLLFFKKHFKFQYPIILTIFALKTAFLFLKGKSFVEIKMRFAAIKDSILNHKGTHSIYRPGWKP